MVSINQPLEPVDAVSHNDPYPYYANLAGSGDFFWEPSLGLWVAASAGAAREALNSDLCRVRPLSEPVPALIQGSASGEIFRHLIRMQDGERHCLGKQAVMQALTKMDMSRLESRGGDIAAQILADPVRCPPLAFALPAAVLSTELGHSDAMGLTIAGWIRDFVCCLSPLSDALELERANTAAENLIAVFTERLTAIDSQPGGDVLRELRNAMWESNVPGDNVVVANAIGFLSQACEATAGLIGNTLNLLAMRPDVRESLERGTVTLSNVIQDVLRFDPPIQNTRRFVVRHGVLRGNQVRSGQVILIVLAAANRDPVIFERFEMFDPHLDNCGHFAFGSGVHSCPGRSPATTIAATAVETMLSTGRLDHVPDNVDYLISINARIPRIPGVTVTAGGPHPETRSSEREDVTE